MNLRSLLVVGLILLGMVYFVQRDGSRSQEGAFSSTAVPRVQTESTEVKGTANVTSSKKVFPAESPHREALNRKIAKLIPDSKHQEENMATLQKAISGYLAYKTGRQLGNGNFEVLRLQALPAQVYRKEMGAVVAQKEGMVYVLSDQTLSGGYPAVVKKSNGALGYLSGTVIANSESRAEAEASAINFGLILKFYDEDLKRAYLAAVTPQDVLNALDLLTADGMSVNAEIVLGFKRN